MTVSSTAKVESVRRRRRQWPVGSRQRRRAHAGSARRATAQSMAASQRDISVSEFFAKNRHLLGFDNPRKALLTTVKEAVDNALDACEEAGILPEIWVHIQRVGQDRYKVGVQDNGPGILKKQIPLIFGKLLYGSKFHRLRMSRGQQGIGISAAGMHGLLTTGKPVKIMSKVSRRDPAHYYEIQIDTKRNLPEILNGRGEGIEIPPNHEGQKAIEKYGIEWIDLEHGTRVTIELEARYQRGRGSVDDYLEQTAIANPHVAIHYTDPDDEQKDYVRVTEQLPPEPKEIKPHPYGVELGRLVAMLKETQGADDFAVPGAFVFARQPERRPAAVRSGEDQHAGEPEEDRPPRGRPALPGDPADEDSRPGHRLHRPDRRGADPQRACGRWCRASSTRRPRGRRPSIAAIPSRSRSGWPTAARRSSHRVSREALGEMLEESDARTLRQFLITTFQGLGADAADKILAEADVGTPRLAGPAQAGRRRPPAPGPAKRQPQRRPVDERAPLRQPRAACNSRPGPAPSRKR